MKFKEMRTLTLKNKSNIEEGLSRADYKKAQAIVNDPKTKGGNYDQAWKDLEKWKRGSTKDKKVLDMLRIAHEEHEECPKCKGTGCEHCDDKGYHITEGTWSVPDSKKKLQAIRKEGLDVQEKLSPKEMEKRLAMIKKAVEKINKKNADQAKKDALKMMKDSGMFDEGIDEGTITTSVSDPKENKLVQTAKKAGLKVKIQPGKGDGMMGDDLATFTGTDAKLIKYFKDHMGFKGGNISALKKEFESVE